MDRSARGDLLTIHETEPGHFTVSIEGKSSDLYNTKAACEYLQIKQWWLLQLVARGDIPVIRIGREVLFTEDALVDALLCKKKPGRPRKDNA